MSLKTPEERAQEVALLLVGTCECLDFVSTEAERDDMRFCTALDAAARQCDECNYWVDAEEINSASGESLCNDCVESRE
jgi:hypothetical protein